MKYVFPIILLLLFISCTLTNTVENPCCNQPSYVLSFPPKWTETKTQTIIKTTAVPPTPEYTIEYSHTMEITNSPVPLLFSYKELEPGNYLIYSFPNSNKSYYVISEQGKEAGRLNIDIQCYFDVSPDNKLIAFTNDNGLNVYSLEDEVVTTIPGTETYTGCIQLSWGPDSK